MTSAKRINAAACLLLAALVIATPANAQRSAYVPEYESFYAGLAIGVADFSDEYLDVGYGDTAWTLEASAGFRFDWLWSIEGTVQTLSDIEDNDVFGSGTERLDFDTGVSAASLRLRLWFPVSELYSLQNEISVFGFAGVQATVLERSAVETTSGASFRNDETNYGLTLGGGMTYRIGRFNLRGSLNWTDLNSIDGGEIVSATLGVELDF